MIDCTDRFVLIMIIHFYKHKIYTNVATHKVYELSFLYLVTFHNKVQRAKKF